MTHQSREHFSAGMSPQFDADFFSQIVTAIADPVFVKDPEHRWVYVNEAFCDFVGHRREELLGKSDYDFFPTEQAEVFWKQDDLVLSKEEVNVDLQKISTAASRQAIISTKKLIIKDRQGTRYILGIISDVTEEERRKRHQQQIAFILKHLVLGVPQDEILKIVLRVAEEALPGVIATILLIDPQTRRLHPAVRSKLPKEFSAAIDGTPAQQGMGSCGEAVFRKERYVVEDIATHPNWQRVRELALKHNLRACWSQPVFSFDGEVAGTFALYFPQKSSPEPFDLEVLTALAQLTTITLEHHQIKDEAEQLRRLLSDMINAMPSSLIAVDVKGTILQWNAEAQKLTGVSFDAAHGRPLDEVLLLDEERLASLMQAIEQGRPLNWTRWDHSGFGSNLWLDLTLYPLSAHGPGGSVLRIDDVTNQVRLEQMMIQTEKIHSLGGLTAGMAHEINNPLAGILQNIQIMKNRLQKGLQKNKEVASACGGDVAFIEEYMRQRNIHSLMDSVIEAGQRASSIVKNMLSFCRQENADIRANDLCELMDKTLELLDNDYDQTQKYDFRNLTIERVYQANLPLILCGASSLQQVFFNLLKNAAQAMIETENPKISIRISFVDDWLQIAIEDNGPGMDPQLLRHIFEPFFTTKPVGIGTGLGLAVAYFIITDSHQGRMSVESQPGNGTGFLIELPLVMDVTKKIEKRL